jgi:hypothetical protein
VAVLGAATNVQAYPLLQLDIAGGQYDTDTKTIVATSNPFTLFAILTPGRHDPTLLLDKTYYISAAVSPAWGGDLGSFTWNGSQVDVTGDMVYGKPPIEAFGELQVADHGDLVNHQGDLYPTFFTEFAFQFSSLSRINTYDSSLDRSGPVNNPIGESYLAAFAVDTTNLNPNFVIHFDLYNDLVKACGAEESGIVSDPNCLDIDIRNYAPFGNDAQSPPVPEPASMLLLGGGLVAGAIRKRQK